MPFDVTFGHTVHYVDEISMITCVINICHIVALCRLTSVVVDNAKKSELARIRIRIESKVKAKVCHREK